MSKDDADIIKEFARSLLEDPDYKEAIKRRLMSGEAEGLERMFYHYAYGKPAEKMELEAGTTLSDLVMASRRLSEKEERIQIEGELI